MVAVLTLKSAWNVAWHASWEKTSRGEGEWKIEILKGGAFQTPTCANVGGTDLRGDGPVNAARPDRIVLP